MRRLNVLGLETRSGYRTMELFEGDVTSLQQHADVLVVSSYVGDYAPVPGTVIGALEAQLKVSVAGLSRTPAYDFRDSLGVWISRRLDVAPFTRILCAELTGQPLATGEVLENVFVGLSILEAKGGQIGSVVLPLLGTGSQGLDEETVIRSLLHAGELFLGRSLGAQTLRFVEHDTGRAERLANAMDKVLGRVTVSLPKQELVESLRQDIRNRLYQATALFELPDSSLRNDWLGLLAASEVRSFELGVLSRRLLEVLVTKLMGASKEPLYSRIRALETSGKVAPWICGYMHVLRHLGNEAAHETAAASDREPPRLETVDLALGLFCVERLLEFWLGFHEKGRHG
jgi:hypothetical protein